MEDHLRTLENIEAIHKSHDGDKKKSPSKPSATSLIVTINDSRKRCIVCRGSHQVDVCQKFKSMRQKDRYLAVRNSRCCLNCFAESHFKKDCQEAGCKICDNGEKHHHLLHFTRKSRSKEVPKKDQKLKSQESHQSNQSSSKNQEVVLPTAIVRVFDCNGIHKLCRVLIDNGSQSNFISNDLVRSLNLKKEDVNMSINGLSGKVATRIKKKVQVTVQSRLNEKSFELECNIVNKVSSYTPPQQMKFDKSKIPANVQLADPKVESPAEVDLLIGAEFFFDLILNGKMEVEGLPTLIETVFGWAAVGTVGKRELNAPPLICHLSIQEKFESYSPLRSKIKKKWKFEPSVQRAEYVKTLPLGKCHVKIT
jgi:hypothetical protein